MQADERATEAPHQLVYGTQPPSHRRWLRLFYALLLLSAVVFGAWRAKDAVHRWQARRAYRQTSEAWYVRASNHQEAPTVLKYSEDPVDAPPGGFKESVRGSGFSVSYIDHQDPTVDLLPMVHGNGDPVLMDHNHILFTHARTNSDGI